jgi:hypothetical protein
MTEEIRRNIDILTMLFAAIAEAMSLLRLKASSVPRMISSKLVIPLRDRINETQLEQKRTPYFLEM